MSAKANLVEVAALVGDTARATMLAALMGGQALTGTELAFLARISRPTASEHLSKLVAARLLAATRKRRFTYYRIASPLVAKMLESLKAVAAIEVPARHSPRSAADERMRFARTCYDHLAGSLAVAIADALVKKKYIVLSDEGGEITLAGVKFLTKFGVGLDAPGRRIFCRPCLDWSERRYHLAGHTGAQLLRHMVDLGWFERVRDSRAMRLTPAGAAGLHKTFGISYDAPRGDIKPSALVPPPRPTFSAKPGRGRRAR